MTLPLAAPSIFDSFNARALAPQQVAQTFVPPRRYADLLRRHHSVIVGPRGSGKTTLLKMLQGPALEAWRHPRADEYRSLAEFTGVFVPADRAWSAQIEAVGGEKVTAEHRAVLGIAAFTSHVLRELVSAMDYRVHPPLNPEAVPHRRVQISRATEALIVENLAQMWHIRSQPRSLLTLKFSLNARLSEIMEIGMKERLSSEDGRAERLRSVDFLHLHFLTSVGAAARLFNELADSGDGKWALLFDELELAPQWIRDELVGSLRSIDDRLLFKLSLCPFTNDIRLLRDVLGPMPGHDFETIPLWYPQKEAGYEFCEALLKQMLLERGLGEVSSRELFGTSEFETLPEEWKQHGTAYRQGSRLQRRFTSMAVKDVSFRRYLMDRKIPPNRLEVVQSDDRAAEIRKITSLVAVRDTFRAPERTTREGLVRRLRSRKIPKLYMGASSLFAMAEGNPRWFIGIVKPLLDSYAKATDTVADADQNREVAKAAHRFRALLRTIPTSSGSARPPHTLLGILDTIGEFFFRHVVVEDFNPDPPGSFVVDNRCGPEIVRGLGEALNAGAIVYVPDESGELVLSHLGGKRFRLSYLLAPEYGLPIRLGRPIALSAILQSIEESSSREGQRRFIKKEKGREET